MLQGDRVQLQGNRVQCQGDLEHPSSKISVSRKIQRKLLKILPAPVPNISKLPLHVRQVPPATRLIMQAIAHRTTLPPFNF